MMKRKFSIGIPYGLNNWHLIFELLHSDYFEGVEIPADYLSSRKLPRVLDKTKMKVVNVLDPVQVSLSRSISEQNDPVKSELFNLINTMISKNYKFKINNISLDLGFDLNNQEKYYDAKINFLKNFAYSLYTNNMNLCLPIRVPDSDDPAKFGTYMNDAITKTMLNSFRICMNLFPHEVKNKHNPDKMYDIYMLNMELLRIVYEPETGNYITKKLLKYWLEPLDNISFAGPVILCPKTSNFNLFENEVKKISSIIERM